MVTSSRLLSTSVLLHALLLSSVPVSQGFTSPAAQKTTRYSAVQPLAFWQSLFPEKTADTSKSATPDTSEIDAKIATAQALLETAAETKKEDSETVIQSLLDLEQLMRQKSKAQGEAVGEAMREDLNGDWQLVFTTGTKNTQEKYGKINYFPIKAVQTFRTQQLAESEMRITNGIFVSDFPLLQFFGPMDFDTRKRKLEFDFDKLKLFNALELNLGKGQAAELGAKSGLGSDSNVENSKRGKQAFFNWISANDKIATARGGGGGLALWKRIGDGKDD